jgi:hypothetical protein
MGKCEEFAKEYGTPYFEVSAKTGQNVEEAFLDIISRMKREKLDQNQATASKDRREAKVTAEGNKLPFYKLSIPSSTSSGSRHCCSTSQAFN